MTSQRTLSAAMAMACAAALASAATPALAATRPDADGARWWRHIETLAGDRFEGRLTGSPGYLAAADYVAAAFRKAGAKPAGAAGTYFQSVPFITQTVDQEHSQASVTIDGKTTPLTVGDDLMLSAAVPQPTAITAPLVFIGYGLALPEAGHDDIGAQDLRGKVAVVIFGGPAEVPGVLKAHSRIFALNKALEKAGAAGLISIPNPHTMDIPWDRIRKLGRQSGMYINDPAFQDLKGPHLVGMVNPERAQTLFAGSGHSLADIMALVDAHKPITGFPLNATVTASVAMSAAPLTSPNVAAVIPGSGKLKRQYVVVSAHLDHLGKGVPIQGDPIYHGAMDNASGIASMLEVARQLGKGTHGPRRSILFVAVTGEEKGLLGSRYFAENPTVPKGQIVADINMDEPLPLFALKHVLVMGEAESSLGASARAAALAQGIDTVPDEEPDRFLFVRSDNYSFVRTGVPAVSLSFGHPKGTPEDAAIKDWNTNRYHSPQDNLSQPVDKAAASQFNAYLAALVRKVATDPVRPSWNSDSFFKRFEVKAAASK